MAKFTRELDELVANGVVTPEVAENIRGYYNKPSQGASLLVIAFGVIGALLIGMGVVLIIAHNWDELSTGIKLMIGLAPLLIAQALAGYVIIKDIQSQAWRESVGVVLIFAVATAIAIVSQVYNISGSFERFLLVWATLTLPVMYLLKARISSLLFWMIITWYSGEVNSNSDSVYYWLLALAATPFFIHLVKKTPDANSVSFHNWVIGFSIAIALGFGHYDSVSSIIVASYISLFSVFLLLGQLPVFAERRLINNAWLIGGSAGTIGILLGLTFEWVHLPSSFQGWLSPICFIWIVLSVIAGWLLYKVGKENGFRNVLSKSYTFLIFPVLVLIGLIEPTVARGLTNVLLLALGIYTIREGALSSKLWKMNYGLLILSVLIACRFFDTDISFALRGLLFVAIGAGFFGMNYYMIRKRKVIS
jgi:uncharacterized membrane protein